MKTSDIIIGSAIISIGIAVHGYFTRKPTEWIEEKVVYTERRYTAVANHATDLATRFMVLDRDTGKCRIFNCKGENTDWYE